MEIPGLELEPKERNLRNLTFYNISFQPLPGEENLDFEYTKLEGKDGMKVVVPKIRYQGMATQFIEEGEFMSHERTKFQFSGIIDRISFDVVIENPVDDEDEN
mmetsp:Transcript_37014/g.35735  ORF Transcript_37014/g.35735 Transcript_37014/m.35735 type:complete len:103 (+) Transcript_37014:145-453(+)|eukprot:CAMPEP_0170542272 /NCGR_PEP_ID=MMETSP0211-20121228/1749_1 /TAXON_ID=311385 /ORGANISM="Pseudokeronopsis sp., Strain OXSARD2" /LENGTH=102 /DNA_ID=CAMNT_0010845281 /DNA_START=145 /DNA_END=453 /DNA_ORIENTATION=-